MFILIWLNWSKQLSVKNRRKIGDSDWWLERKAFKIDAKSCFQKKKKKKRNHKSKIVPNWFHGKINISVMIITKLSYIHTMNARFHGKKYKIKAKLSPRFLQKFSQINISLESYLCCKLISRFFLSKGNIEGKKWAHYSSLIWRNFSLRLNLYQKWFAFTSYLFFCKMEWNWYFFCSKSWMSIFEVNSKNHFKKNLSTTIITTYFLYLFKLISHKK